MRNLNSQIFHVPARAWSRARREFLKRVLPMKPRSDLEKLGTSYGGWIVPTSLFDSDSICYLVGVGEDISFDLALMERFGCAIHGFDPTPRAIEYIDVQARNVRDYRFHPLGLWSDDSIQRFYEPSKVEHVSHSIVNLQQTSNYFEASCRRLSSMMAELGHSRLDLLKIDIEGAEYVVLQSVIDDGLDITTICVEFDQPTPLRKIIGMVRQLREAQYDLVAIDAWNMTFTRAPEPGAGPSP